ncbi:MAG: hypothetical protein ACSHXI_14280 [Hoeflea sp.]|uniref:hypothetical protein n=1 Tax=Hoeflea sp. TaxID=1940281 RepID=UPI003EF7212B
MLWSLAPQSVTLCRTKQSGKSICYARAVQFEMGSFERWEFVIWLGACGDAVRAPLAVRDALQSVEEQAHSIAYRFAAAIAGTLQLPRLNAFPTPTLLKFTYDALHRSSRCFPCWREKSNPSNRLH